MHTLTLYRHTKKAVEGGIKLFLFLGTQSFFFAFEGYGDYGFVRPLARPLGPGKVLRRRDKCNNRHSAPNPAIPPFVRYNGGQKAYSTSKL